MRSLANANANANKNTLHTVLSNYDEIHFSEMTLRVTLDRTGPKVSINHRSHRIQYSICSNIRWQAYFNHKSTQRVCIVHYLFIALMCLPFFVCIFYWNEADVGENWAFASKLSDLSENFDEDGGGGGENGFSDLDIFTVKFLGSTTVKAAKSEVVTANAIKNIISTAKGECPPHTCLYPAYQSCMCTTGQSVEWIFNFFLKAENRNQ